MDRSRGDSDLHFRRHNFKVAGNGIPSPALGMRSPVFARRKMLLSGDLAHLGSWELSEEITDRVRHGRLGVGGLLEGMYELGKRQSCVSMYRLERT